MADVLAIVGSTRFADIDGIDIARSIIEGVIERRRPEVIVSGGAPGIDTLAARIANENGIELREFLPLNQQWEPHGYKQRNDQIVEECTRLLRVHCRWGSTYGSGYTHDRADAMGKVCWNVMLPSNIDHGELRVQLPDHQVPLQVRAGRIVEGQPYARKFGWPETDPAELITRLGRAAFRVRWKTTRSDGRADPPAAAP